MQTDPSNTLFQQAVAFVTQTGEHLFLTGKAGTGKTTFLKYIRENCFKKLAVVAPTGVAAINAGGVTIHSFFQLPFGLYLPDYPGAWGNTDNKVYNKNQLLSQLRLSAAKRELIRELDLLIIDEISMVRADVLDAMDAVLRAIRRRPETPFGGIQLLYIGDLFQLPPVVKDTERSLMRNTYLSPFFFDAEVIREAPPVCLELQHIYRQQDPLFIRCLNNVRNNCCTQDDLDLLDEHYRPDFSPREDDGFITLASHNYIADAINREQLARLPGKVYRPEAVIEGDFPEQAYPTERELRLKTGAQVMFIKNDKGEKRRFFNGKIGVLRKIDEKGKKLHIAFPGEPDLLELSPETWKNIRYGYDAEDDRIEEQEIGAFTQYPIRLAWAITIHKSQGLTFDKAIIDAGAAFAPGQVYVALSRLRGLDGLVLRTRIRPGSILTETRIRLFSEAALGEEKIQRHLEAAQRAFVRQSLLQAFDWEKLAEKTRAFPAANRRGKSSGPEDAVWYAGINRAASEQLQVAEKFRGQLEGLLEQAEPDDYEQLHTRTEKAARWFAEQLEEKLTGPTRAYINLIKTKARAKKRLTLLQDLLLVFERKKQQVLQAIAVTEGLRRSFQLPQLMEQVAGLQRPQVEVPAAEEKESKPEKGATRRISLKMFREGKSVADIATERGLTPGTIEGHLATFVETGEIDIYQLVTPAKLATILNALNEDPRGGAAGIRKKLGNLFSFGEIKAAMLFRQWEKQQKAERR
ncbi:helix-turn-helix domain-containing protein [Compostibacter hankyongensis]|uniref:Helix-turn-helix domain-containing protein n=1 Tax=Compostibacter hankyongensis TaxID=1007089 RepID=A0ABP8FC54_9BACT